MRTFQRSSSASHCRSVPIMPFNSGRALRPTTVTVCPMDNSALTDARDTRSSSFDGVLCSDSACSKFLTLNTLPAPSSMSTFHLPSSPSSYETVVPSIPFKSGRPNKPTTRTRCPLEICGVESTRWEGCVLELLTVMPWSGGVRLSRPWVRTVAESSAVPLSEGAGPVALMFTSFNILTDPSCTRTFQRSSFSLHSTRVPSCPFKFGLVSHTI
mmetsp:Transcript_86146/g.134717  ORF Transcript_86146/g.134717 Transcript_86146/m.134717 type:complete len:213 (-) Transcript_86146:604-1242(-)